MHAYSQSYCVMLLTAFTDGCSSCISIVSVRMASSAGIITKVFPEVGVSYWTKLVSALVVAYVTIHFVVRSLHKTLC